MKDKITIVTDSASDLLKEEADQLGVKLLPITVSFDGTEYLDGVTISRDEFYGQLRPDHLPKTSLISPGVYEDCFREEIDKGNHVVCLVMSSEISGCYQSATLASQDFGDQVRVIDTRHFCGSQQLLVRLACQLRDQGLSADEIADTIKNEKHHVQIIALFDTLDYVKAGGRISGAKAAIGNLLTIKPVISITDGAVDLIGKARGSKKGNNYLMEFVKNHGGIDWNRPILLSYSGQSDELLAQYIKDSAALYEGRDADSLPRSRVGATVGTYAGPGAIAFAFFPA